MTTFGNAMMVLLIMGQLVSMERLYAQIGETRQLLEGDILDYLENDIHGRIQRRVNLPQSAVEQLRARIFQSPEVSIPLVRKISMEGRATGQRPPISTRANNVTGGAERLLGGLARTLARDTTSGRLMASAERLSPFPTPRPGECVVLGVMGDVTVVRNLTALYAAGGAWIGTRPSTRQRTLTFRFQWEEDRVSLEESLTVALTRVRRLVPNGTYEGKALWSILLHDRTDLRVYDDHLEISSGSDLRPPVHSYESYSLETSRVQGDPVTLMAFEGEAPSRSGRVGRFSIPIDEVAAVECAAEASLR